MAFVLTDDSGGSLITVLDGGSLIPTNVNLRVFIFDGTIEHRCYSGVSGQGLNVVTKSAGSISFVSPPLPTDGPYDVRIYNGGVLARTLANAVIAQNRVYKSRVYSMRQLFAPKMAVGFRSLSLETALGDFQESAPSIGAIGNAAVAKGSPFSLVPVVSNPSGFALTWTVQAGSLPTSMSLNAATGAITGTDNVAETKTGIVLRASYLDADAHAQHVDTNAFSIQVFTTPTISNIANQNATQNAAFTFTPSTTNPDPLALTWSLHAGTLPTGFTLNTATGNISGTDSIVETKTGLVLRISFTTIDGVVRTVDSNSFQIAVNVLLLQPPNVASGAGFNPVRWYTAQSPDGNVPSLLSDGQNAPSTWHDFGSDATDLPFFGTPSHVKWRQNGGPGGFRPSMEWVSQQPAGGGADMYTASPGSSSTLAAMTVAIVFRRTDVNGALRMLFGTGPGDSNRQIYVGEVGNAGVGAFNHNPELLDNTIPASLPQSAYAWCLIEFNDGSSRVKVGDGTTTHETTGTIGNGDHSMQGYFLGTFHAQQLQGDFSWIGHIQDVVVYAAVDSTLRGQLTTYLNNKIAGL